MDHCALPDLPGREPFGGRILSHDFVEAALIRKAGWQVWLAHDIEGTYEEGPPTLIDSAKRDRRWCQGNMQHAWLVAVRGFRPANRIHLLMGVMAYVSSPLWLLFLILSTIHVFNQVLSHTHRFSPEIYTSIFGKIIEVPESLSLFLFTLLLLFLPKVISVISVMQDDADARRFGGRTPVIFGAVLETALSVLLAPITCFSTASSYSLRCWGRASRGWRNVAGRGRHRLA